MDIKELRERYWSMLSFFRGVGDKFAQAYINDVLKYLGYLAGVDKKFSEREIQFIKDVMNIKIEDLPALLKQVNLDDFITNIPQTLQLTVELDKKKGNNFIDSNSQIYTNIFGKLGLALLEVDGVTKVADTAITDYMNFLVDYCIDALDTREEVNTDKKTKTAPKKGGQAPKTVINQKPVDFEQLIQEYMEMAKFFFQKGGDDLLMVFVLDILQFLASIACVNKKPSKSESDFVERLVMTKLLGGLESSKSMDWDSFANTIPEILEILLKLDQEREASFKGGYCYNYISSYGKFGNALLEVDGKTKGNQTNLTKYLEFLTQHCENILNPQKGASSNTKNATNKKSQEKTKKPKEKEPEPAKSKPAPSAKSTTGNGKRAIQISASGPTTMLAFWEALKPFLAQMRHLEFDKTVIKETDSHNAKATIITGAYNSIMIRKTQKALRLELYINTDTEAGNLQILDHIQKNVKIPSALKDQVQFNRKEGRLAQRIFVNLEGFELSDRSCWADYITKIISVADDFFDALEKPMKELVG